MMQFYNVKFLIVAPVIQGDYYIWRTNPEIIVLKL